MPETRLIVGCGYLGERVALRWAAAGDEVFVLTRSVERARRFSAQGLHPLVGDVTDRASLTQLPAVTTVLYAVGYDRTAEPDKRTVSVSGPANVLAALPDGAAHVIHVSSTSVYGQSDGEWIDEESPADPVTDSGRICRDAELVFAECGSRAVSRVTIFRSAGLYGPDRLLRRAQSLRTGDAIPGNPDAFLNLIHVSDAAEVITRAAEAADQCAPLYLLSDGNPVRRRDYYGHLASLVDASPPDFRPSEQGPRTVGLNKRCRNTRLLNDFPGTLQFADYRVGLQQAVSSSAGLT